MPIVASHIRHDAAGGGCCSVREMHRARYGETGYENPKHVQSREGRHGQVSRGPHGGSSKCDRSATSSRRGFTNHGASEPLRWRTRGRSLATASTTARPDGVAPAQHPVSYVPASRNRKADSEIGLRGEDTSLLMALGDCDGRNLTADLMRGRVRHGARGRGCKPAVLAGGRGRERPWSSENSVGRGQSSLNRSDDRPICPASSAGRKNAEEKPTPG